MFTQEGNEYSGNLKFGFKNNKGEIVVPFIYDYIPRTIDMSRMEFYTNSTYRFLGEFEEGFALVYKKDQGYGFVDKTGKEIIKCQFTSALAFSDGLAPVRNNQKQWGYINYKGELVIPFQYSWPQQFKEGIAFVSSDDETFYYINVRGEVISKIGSQRGNHFAVFSNGRGSININGKIGYIDEKGEMVIPCNYDYGTQFFANGLAMVEINNKWGVIDKYGNTRIPFNYSYMNGWFDTDGMYYYTIFEVEFKGNKDKLPQDTKKGLLRDDGKTINPNKYNKIRFDKRSQTAIVTNKDGKIGVFDLTILR